jgi:RimJ/RimL family protein N-acetyltransferase
MTDETLDDGFCLVACGRDGRPARRLDRLPTVILETCEATATFYERVGFHPPWIGYIALDGDVSVGGGAFVGPPDGDRVEIAYFTLPECQSQGYATRIAASLVSIARGARPGIQIYAKTAPEQGASSSILTRLGFRQIGIAVDDEIGEAWAWLLE